MRLFEELGNDPELARSCLAMAAFLELDPESKVDPMRAHEVQRLRGRADDILERIGSSGLPELPQERTDPGL